MKFVNINKVYRKIYLIAIIFILQIGYFANFFDVIAESDIASGNYQNISWVIDSNGLLTISGTGNYYNDNIYGDEYAPWIQYSEYIKSADVKITSGITSLSNMFRDCCNMTQVVFEKSFDTSQVVQMDMMFYNCKNLTNVDISLLDTSNLYNAGQIFDGCESLTNINLTNFTSNKIDNMMYMFNDCKSLVNIDVSKLNTSNTAFLNGIFSGCLKLENIDLSNWDVSNVMYIDKMFYGCTQIKNIKMCNWNLSKAEYMESVFDGCINLTELDLNNVNTPKAFILDKMFRNCKSLANVDLRSFNTSNAKKMQSMFENCESLKNIDLSNFDISNIYNFEYMFKNCKSLENVNLFQQGINKESVYLNEIFSNCISLKSIDMSNYCFIDIEEANNMFYGDINLIQIKSPKYETTYGYNILLPQIDEKKWVDETNILNKTTEMKSEMSYISIDVPSIGDIYLTSNAYSIGDNNVYESEDQYISKINPNTTVGAFRSEISTNGNVRIYNCKGEILEDSEFIGTGMSVEIYDETGSILLKVIERGDIDGNGKITITDLSLINKYILDLINLENEKNVAADIDQNGWITVTDLSKINQYIIGTISSL